jgi:hypothetical protein
MSTLPEPAPADRTIRRMLLAFGVVFAVIVGVVVIAVRNISRAEQSADWVNHTHAVIQEADSIVASLHLSDSALRTYVMAGNASDRTAAQEALSAIVEHLEIARALTRAEPSQHTQLLQLEPLVTAVRRDSRKDPRCRQGGSRGSRPTTPRRRPGAGSAAIRRRHRAGWSSDEVALLAERGHRLVPSGPEHPLERVDRGGT